MRRAIEVAVEEELTAALGAARYARYAGRGGYRNGPVLMVMLMLVCLTTPVAAAAQPTESVPRVGYLFSFAPPAGRHYWEASQQGLRDLGYVDGQNIQLEPRWADGHHERLPELAAELVRRGVDVIVSAATPASRAAHAATGSIPIVFVAVADPLRAGLVASLARPGGNVTGMTL